eukprot:jgi/Botrbrau1/10544/Bobra.7_1s0022.1
MSVITRGTQMTPVLNKLGIQAATIGNHEFDFGMDMLEDLISKSNFPWILSNIRDRDTGKPIAGCKERLVLEWNEVKVGLMGLVEANWYNKLTTVDTDYWDFTDPFKEAKKQARLLREEGAQLVVALTHFKLARDLKLAKKVEEVDLILGGHDHEYLTQYTQPHGTLVVKSGKEWEWLTVVKVRLGSNGGRPKVDYLKVDITPEVEPDASLQIMVDTLLHTLTYASTLYKEVGYSSVPLDGTRASNRTQETNLGNWLADMWRVQAAADVALLNAGSLKIDEVIPAGTLNLATIMKIFIKIDETVVLGVSGERLLAALENAVAFWPEAKSQFCQVSGLRFDFDGTKPPGSRVILSSVTVGGKPLELAHTYSVACKEYLARGKEGFSSLEGCEKLSDEEESPPLPTLVRQTFKQLTVLTQMVAQQQSNSNEHAPQKLFKAKAAKWVKAYAEQARRPRINLAQSQIAVLDPALNKYVIAPVMDQRIRQVGAAAPSDTPENGPAAPQPAPVAAAAEPLVSPE